MPAPVITAMGARPEPSSFALRDLDSIQNALERAGWSPLKRGVRLKEEKG